MLWGGGPAGLGARRARAPPPTDGVHDFVTQLARAVETRGHAFAVERLPTEGRATRTRLEALLDRHPGAWFVLQYTALQWSTRAIPVAVPSLLRLVRRRGARAGIVFHDIAPYAGSRLVDRARRVVQRRVMRQAARAADRAFIAGQHRTSPRVPVGFAGWVSARTPPLTFLPVGSNLSHSPAHPAAPPRASRAGGRVRVGVFGVSDHRAHVEVPQIAEILRRAQVETGPLEFVAFGRGTDRARPLFARLLPPDTDARILGVLPAESALAELRQLDALIFVRHHVSAQRGSAMAAVAAGVPIVGFRGRHTGPAVEAWGMRLADEGRLGEVADHLVAVTQDAEAWLALHQAGLAAADAHLTWDGIATRFLDALTP